MAEIGRKESASIDLGREAKLQRQAVENARKSADKPGRLLRPKTRSQADQLATRLALISPSDKSGLERVIGTRDIVNISFLHRALIAARSVCRIKVVATDGDPPVYGTGFLIAPGLLLTNNHVLPDENTASSSLAEFNYELDLNWVERQRRLFGIVPSRIFYTDHDLDITIVAVSPVAHDGTPIAEFGTLKLIPNSGKALEGEYVSIIQHPQGEPKQVVMRENQIIRLDLSDFGSSENFIHYTADTESGSSGSPVFNDQWDLVAVHHKAIADFFPDERPKNRQGGVWTQDQGEDARAWIANEGVRVSAIVRSILLARDDDPHAARIAAIMAFEPPTQMRSVLPNNDFANRVDDLSAYPDLKSFESTRYTSPEYLKNAGFDTNFLDGIKVDLPKVAKRNEKRLSQIAFVPKGTRSPVLDYTHFSLVIHKARKLALWTAVNIDGSKAYLKKIPNVGWRKDPRVEECQTYGAVYGKNRGGTGVQIDKGHQVRRLDPVWGPKDIAEQAAADTFHYTNAVPQEHFYNSELWGNLEDFVLARAINKAQKASVLTGPVLRDDDQVFVDKQNGWMIPKSFWKICIFIRSDGTPSVTGFVMEQTDQIGPLFEANRFNPFTLDQVRVYQKKIAEIEKLTGLDFGDLKKHDKMGVVETTANGLPRPIRRSEDISF